MKQDRCPFQVGDYVRFTPSERTVGLYQDIERFGVAAGKVYQIKSIKDGVYLYFGPEKGGWPWNEFTQVPLNENHHKRKNS
jgi:hypothetical protein